MLNDKYCKVHIDHLTKKQCFLIRIGTELSIDIHDYLLKTNQIRPHDFVRTYKTWLQIQAEDSDRPVPNIKRLHEPLERT